MLNALEAGQHDHVKDDNFTKPSKSESLRVRAWKALQFKNPRASDRSRVGVCGVLLNLAPFVTKFHQTSKHRAGALVYFRGSESQRSGGTARHVATLFTHPYAVPRLDCMPRGQGAQVVRWCNVKMIGLPAVKVQTVAVEFEGWHGISVSYAEYALAESSQLLACSGTYR